MTRITTFALLVRSSTIFPVRRASTHHAYDGSEQPRLPTPFFCWACCEGVGRYNSQSHLAFLLV